MKNIFDSHLVNPTQMNTVVEIMKIYNCRVSEVLNAEWANFYPDKFLILKGMKGSSNVIIRDKFILDLIASLPRLHSVFIFPSIDRFKVYSFVKKYYAHLFEEFKTRKNRKITHGFRYLNVASIDNEKFIRDILNHRSISSGKFYKQKKRKDDAHKKNV